MLELLDEIVFDDVFSLMELSFPEDERRNYEKQRELLSEPDYHLYIKRSPGDDGLQAFIALWEFDEMTYIEHLAVNPMYRNAGLGTQVLRELIALSDKRIVLEVELPETEMARRRIGFYERNGFSYNDHFYLQPPIMDGRNAIELRIMTTDGILDKLEFSRVRDLLYSKVYHAATEDYDENL